jgi:hypothetical protein
VRKGAFRRAPFFIVMGGVIVLALPLGLAQKKS